MARIRNPEHVCAHGPSARRASPAASLRSMNGTARASRCPIRSGCTAAALLHGAQIAYESWGRLNAARDNAILLFTGLSPSAHAAATEQRSVARAGGSA